MEYPNNWFSNGKLHAILVLSVADGEILTISNRVLLSQVRRLNVAVSVCRRYRLSEDIALLMYTLMILKRSDRFRWAWIVVQKRKIQYDKRWTDENNIKARIACLFISKTTIMVNKHETIYFIIFVSDKRLSSFFISSILSFSFTCVFFFVLILSYQSGTCTFFFADISGRNFLSSFGHFWAKLLSQVGGTRAPSAQPPPPPPA